MSDVATPGWLVDRLRRNLREEGIPLEERDLERILEMGLLRPMLAFEAMEVAGAADRLPDHLAAWSDAPGGHPPPAAPPVPPAAASPPPAPAGAGPSNRPRSAGPPSPPEPAAPPAEAAGGPARAAAAPPPSWPARGDGRGDSIATLSGRIRAREISPLELTQRSLARIAERDGEISAFQLVLREQALVAARAADREIAAGTCRGPLHGIPVAIKDLLDMAGTPTTAGSRIRGDRPSGTDAAAVERLRAAGAVIVGKTRLAEFAYSPGSNNSSFGPTRNPRDPSRDAGGSSSGSGAAVADGMVVAALGSDTGGSIRIPASLCGIVGLKPTYGRVSLRGVVPLSWSLDHLGPMARTVTDVALLLEWLAGRDDEDPRTRDVPVAGYAAALEAGARGLRVGVLGDDGERPGSREAEAAWRRGLAVLEAAGATLVPVDLPVLAVMRVVNGALLAMEAAAYHGPTLRERAADYGEFARLRLLSGHAFGPGAYLRAQRARAECRAAFARACRDLDLLSAPTLPGGAPPLGVPAPIRYTAPFNLIGWPVISVPAGTTGEGLPLGMQLVGRPWHEATVLRAARVVEVGGGAR